MNLTLLKKLRAASTREYSNSSVVRRHYRDGYTDGFRDAHENLQKSSSPPALKRSTT